jgi:hypothetical protein
MGAVSVAAGLHKRMPYMTTSGSQNHLPGLDDRDENKIDKVPLCSNRRRYDHTSHLIQPQHACTTDHPCLNFQTI